MIFLARKLIEALLMPAGLGLLLLLAGLLLRRRILLWGALALLWIGSTGFIGDGLFNPLQNAYPALTVDACPKADAIVVLSGGIVHPARPPGPQWGDSVDRYLSGLALAKADKAPLLIFTEGAKFRNATPPTEGETMRQDAIRQGIAADRIRLTGEVWTTADEAKAVSTMPGLRSIILVTSAFHIPRAVMLFRSAGLQVTPFPTDFRTGAQPIGWEWWAFIPSPEAQAKTDAALREYYGLALYKLILPKPPSSPPRP